MSTLVLVFLVIAAALTVALGKGRGALQPPITCAVCRIPAARTDHTAAPGWQCASCLSRGHRIERARREIRMRERERHRAAQQAIEEAERIAHRFDVIRVGTVARTPSGLRFEGWAFQDPKVTAGTAPGVPMPLPTEVPAGELICGWTPAELHDLAHGPACRCPAA